MEIVIEKELCSPIKLFINEFLMSDLKSPLSVTLRRHSSNFRCGISIKYRFSNKNLIFTFDDSSKI
jgi:hypothetical protein